MEESQGEEEEVERKKTFLMLDADNEKDGEVPEPRKTSAPVMNPDGTTTMIKSDGTVLTLLLDASKLVETPDGRIKRKSNGGEWAEFATKEEAIQLAHKDIRGS